MNILITGALGHIGSQLIRDIPRMLPGAGITLVDNLMTQRYCSLFNLPAEGNYRFIEADVLTCDLDRLVAHVDIVVHLAAITDAANSFQNAQQVEKVNFVGTEMVARACARHRCKLIFLSTTSVYGTRKDVVDEACPPSDLRPQSPYAESKLRAEGVLTALGETDGLEFVTLRFGTIFGISPGMRFHTAINKFVWQACAGMPITVWRTALDQQRPYLDLQDAVRAIAFVIQHRWFDKHVYNVLTANSTVREIIDIIRMHVDDVRIECVDTPIMNQLSYTVGRGKFEKLGFVFEGSLATGVTETIAMLKQIRTRVVQDYSKESMYAYSGRR